jgi:polysaccharide pyruvyl transferase WcaK-like protein
MNITVLGWYSHGNCGDESYKLAFPILFPGHNFNFVDSIKSDFDRSSTDLIILGGGDVVKSAFLDDLYNVKDIPMIALSVTVTEGSDIRNLKIFKKLIVRDNMSFGIAKRYHNNVAYLPDFSFILDPNKENGKRIIKEKFDEAGHKLTPRLITVVPNSYIAYNHNDALYRDVTSFNKYASEVTNIAEAVDSSFLFLPFSTKPPWDDRAICSWMADKCKKKYYKNVVIYDKLSVQETLDVISASDAVLSSRLHSTIFSTISGIPFIDVLHHDKNLGFLKTLNREEWSTWFWKPEVDKMEKLLRDFLTVSGQGAELQKFTKVSKEQLKNAASNILR